MFIGHKNDIRKNEYTVLKQFKNKKVLVNSNEIKLISNVCPHQKSLLSVESGTGARVCPYHGWSFDINGNPLGSGLTACKNTTGLTTEIVHEWNNLLFTQHVSATEADFINTEYMQLVETRVDRVNASANNIMDVFLDVDHIELVHAGVYDELGMPDIRTVDWHYYSWGSLQLVPGPNGYGAAWLAVYPNIMIEWQQGAMFITVANDLGNDSSDVVVYKYRDSSYTSELWETNSRIWETAWHQDKTQATLLTEFNQDNLEDSKKHFRNYLDSSS
jgi:phenylpropionate dioxygenase-like ring-hydroxylating dioxygenase large terminal subunit